TGINAQANRDFDRLVELRKRILLYELHRVSRAGDGVLAARKCGGRFRVFLSVSRHQSTTVMPMDRAVPSIIRIADSTLAALRSGILSVAMSRTCFLVTRATLVLFDVAEPLSTPAAFFSRTAAGGVFVMKVKLRSENTVISTGMIIPG